MDINLIYYFLSMVYNSVYIVLFIVIIVVVKLLYNLVIFYNIIS